MFRSRAWLLPRHEEVAPTVARAVIAQHIDPVALFDFEPRREHLDTLDARSALAGNEDPVAGFENRRLACLVVPIGLMPRTRMVKKPPTAPRHDSILADGRSARKCRQRSTLSSHRALGPTVW
jgi:hypothetical protein